MARPAALTALVACLAITTTARADFVRGSIKVDVRDGAGRPREAEVSVHDPGGGQAKVARVGEVYVADGLVDGANEQTVRVRGRIDRGVVFVLGGKRAQAFALGPRDAACDALDGVVVEAVAFARGGGLGAGRLDVQHKGKVVCSAIIAGGAATLRLLPGSYEVVARLAGGGTARAPYSLLRDQNPKPLALRAR